MQIYLVQHGECKPEELDPERTLTESGSRDVQKIADFLRTSSGLQVTEILHSGKARAQQTADLLAPCTTAGTNAVMHYDGLAPKDAVASIKQELEEANRNVMDDG